MVIDTSALIAILQDEPERGAFNEAIEAADPVVDAYKRHVDRTLLRQNLRRTVTERVENLIALQRLRRKRDGRTIPAERC